DAASLRFLARQEIPFGSLARPDEAALNDLLRARLPGDASAAVDAAAATMRERWAAIASAMPLVDPTLEAAAHASLSRVEHELEHLQWKIVRAMKRRDATLRRQFGHAQTLAFPGGAPQERVLGLVYFVNQYGPALIDTLVAELPTEMGRH